MVRTLSHADVLQIESAELDAWRDMYRAMPPAFREQHGAELITVGDTVLTRCRSIGFVHFNAVLNLGLPSSATEAAVDAVVAAYGDDGDRRFTVMHHPFCGPAALADWLRERGCQPRQGWDRVFRFGSPAIPPVPDVRGDVVFVTDQTAASWARFLDGWYGLPTSPWLLALVGRAGWRHATLVRDGRIAATRSMFVSREGRAWLGVEAPVPGLMAPSFEDDHRLLHALLADAAREDVQVFAADVEACNTAREGPAYDRWKALGFSVGYHRTHYVRGG